MMKSLLACTSFMRSFRRRFLATNLHFQPNLKQRIIDIQSTGDVLSDLIHSKQVQHLLEIIKSDIVLECRETEFIYRIKAHLQGSLDRNNLHVYLENRQIILETRKESKGMTSFKTVDGSYLPVIERSLLYIRRAITLPDDVDQAAVTSRSVGDVVEIDLPKLCWMDEQSED